MHNKLGIWDRTYHQNNYFHEEKDIQVSLFKFTALTIAGDILPFQFLVFVVKLIATIQAMFFFKFFIQNSTPLKFEVFSNKEAGDCNYIQNDHCQSQLKLVGPTNYPILNLLSITIIALLFSPLTIEDDTSNIRLEVNAGADQR